MSNIINTYLKIEKCSFEDYNQSSKEFNTIYFITDTLQIFIGDKEYMKTETVKQFQDLLENSLLPEFQNKVYEYIKDQLKNITIGKAESDFIYAGHFNNTSEMIDYNFEDEKVYCLSCSHDTDKGLVAGSYYVRRVFEAGYSEDDMLYLTPVTPNGKYYIVGLVTGNCTEYYTADQKYSSKSKNAQSGVAVAEAMGTIPAWAKQETPPVVFMVALDFKGLFATLDKYGSNYPIMKVLLALDLEDSVSGIKMPNGNYLCFTNDHNYMGCWHPKSQTLYCVERKYASGTTTDNIVYTYSISSGDVTVNTRLDNIETTLDGLEDFLASI